MLHPNLSQYSEHSALWHIASMSILLVPRLASISVELHNYNGWDAAVHATGRFLGNSHPYPCLVIKTDYNEHECIKVQDPQRHVCTNP